jgi:hypothetical protein
MATVTSGRGLNELVVRIVAEYREMPGLSLTPAKRRDCTASNQTTPPESCVI